MKLSKFTADGIPRRIPGDLDQTITARCQGEAVRVVHTGYENGVVTFTQQAEFKKVGRRFVMRQGAPNGGLRQGC